MSKITIVGNAVAIKSSIKMEDLKVVAKYNPNALCLKDEDGEEVFRIGATNGEGSIGKYGISFSSTDSHGYATLTITLQKLGISEDVNVKEVLADTIGAAVGYLNNIEESIASVVDEINDSKNKFMESIEVL